MNIIPFEKSTKLDFSPLITVGMFDGVHLGHQKLLSILKEKAKQLDAKPVVITFDKHPQLVVKP
ncbi:MAG: riboflavin biosynthesis protein RibF, partial [Bacteroidales bacterium]|nr:riboflavin biosynthesis protein RibF [Bacteroidales bacterium]